MKKVLIIIMLMVLGSIQAVELHTGLNGPWHQANNPGQGMVLYIIPDSNQIFIAWFTYAESGGQQLWLTAQGSLEDETFALTIYESVNGQLNSADPLPDQTVWGSGTITFNSCQSADFTYLGNGGQSGNMALSRVTPPINCSEV